MTQLSLMVTRQTPRTRGACEGGERPCRYTACRHHLHAEDERAGRPWGGRRAPPLVVVHSEETCSLDVAERGGLSRTQVGEVMGLGYERVRQLELRALAKLREQGVNLREHAGIDDLGDDQDDLVVRRGPRVRLRVIAARQRLLPL